jgi:hypothetical protein
MLMSNAGWASAWRVPYCWADAPGSKSAKRQAGERIAIIALSLSSPRIFSTTKRERYYNNMTHRSSSRNWRLT